LHTMAQYLIVTMIIEALFAWLLTSVVVLSSLKETRRVGARLDAGD